MFASDLDAASKAQLARGARMVEILKQPQSSPVPVEDQVGIIWAGTNGHIDDVPVTDVRRFEADWVDYLRREHGGLLAGIRETGKLGDDAEAVLGEAMAAFKQEFRPDDSHEIHAADEDVDGREHDDQAQITVQRH